MLSGSETVSGQMIQHHQMHDILIVGSGPSAKLAKDINLSRFTVIAVNHGWMAVDKQWKYWVIPRDYEGKAPDFRSGEEVKHHVSMLNKFGGEMACGYSIMLTASYFALTLKPSRIFYLGADMNYTPDSQGNTHLYGVGLDILKHKQADPDRMVIKHGNGDPDYLTNIYKRFQSYADNAGVLVRNLSGDPNSRLPYKQHNIEEFY